MDSVETVIINASELITCASEIPKSGSGLQDIGITQNGAIAYQNGKIIAVGTTSEILNSYQPKNTIDAKERVVLPGLVDPHTHLPFAGSRHDEYENKVSGKSYSELHTSGGIRYTVKMTREASEEELIEKALTDLDIMMLHGTTLVEAKSGYGLDEENELKLLRVINKVNEIHELDVVPTFLGAHTIPDEFLQNREAYITLIMDLIPKVKDLAEFFDVWCDELGFTLDETKTLFECAKSHGLDLKVHSEQTGSFGGTELAAEMGAVSADHLDFVSPEGIEMMKSRGTIPVLLPGVAYHLMEFNKDIPVREMIKAELPVALATDYNPGSCRTQSMQAIMETAVRIYRMNYAETINAATINAAYAIKRGDTHGSLQAGKIADILISDCETHGELMNNFGINHIHTVIKNGQTVVEDRTIKRNQ